MLDKIRLFAQEFSFDIKSERNAHSIKKKTSKNPEVRYSKVGVSFLCGGGGGGGKSESSVLDPQ